MIGPDPGLRVMRKAKAAGVHGLLTLVSLFCVGPFLWAAYTSLRTYDDTAVHGYFSFPSALTLSNFSTAWSQADLPRYFVNTLIILVPALVLILLLSSYVAFAITRVGVRFSRTLLVAALASSMLPPQVLLTGVFKIYVNVPLPSWLSSSGLLYNSYLGVILVHVATQIGFCIFVLVQFMRRLPVEIIESGLVDGAGPWRQYWTLTLPVCRPALAALGTLEFTWIYNDFFWALTLISSGNQQPITTALNNLKEQFFVDNNLLAAGSIIIAVPTIVVFIFAQRHFISGLTLGTAKG